MKKIIKKVLEDVCLLTPDGKEEVGTIPADMMEKFMFLKGIKSRSVAAIKKAALDFIREAMENHYSSKGGKAKLLKKADKAIKNAHKVIKETRAYFKKKKNAKISRKKRS